MKLSSMFLPLALLLALSGGPVSIAAPPSAEDRQNQSIGSETKEPEKVQDANNKCSVLHLLKRCAQKEEERTATIAALQDKVKAASDSLDPEKMKATLLDLQNLLADMKKDHEKSSQAMKQVHERMEKLKEQIKLLRDEHRKAADIIEDEDMDDVIWAY